MDILYIYKNGCSNCNGLELKMSLRSIEKHGKNIGKVFVTDKVDWASDKLIQVDCNKNLSFAHTQKDKHINMIKTLLYVVDNTDIGDEFLISMDDHFYIKDVDFDNYPYYCKNTKQHRLPTDSNSFYQLFLIRNRKQLKRQSLTDYYFTLHRNMHCSRKIIEECRTYLEKVISDKLPCEPFLYLLNYQYTKYGFDFVVTKDIKIHNVDDFDKLNLDKLEVFSTYDFTTGDGLCAKLEKLFPNKSKYEK